MCNQQKKKFSPEKEPSITHSGKLLIDATGCPQYIAYPTDLKLLNASREKSEELIVKLYDPAVHLIKKPRTYREEARTRYIIVSKKKVYRRSEVRDAYSGQTLPVIPAQTRPLFLDEELG
jgi:IS5 family transposase